MGLPGSGKTTLAKKLIATLKDKSNLSIVWFNADDVREKYKDWDFSLSGRIRQGKRMRHLCDNAQADLYVVDFVAPLKAMRDSFEAHYTIWVDTIETSRFNDTNLIFEAPLIFDFGIKEKDADTWALIIGLHVLKNR